MSRWKAHILTVLHLHEENVVRISYGVYLAVVSSKKTDHHYCHRIYELGNGNNSGGASSVALFRLRASGEEQQRQMQEQRNRNVHHLSTGKAYSAEQRVSSSAHADIDMLIA